MRFDPDNPKWTAYVLGELSEDERNAIEEEIAGDEKARSFVEELRATAGLLNEELQAEAAPLLPADQRRKIVERTDKPRWSWGALLTPSYGLSAAAGLLLVVTASWYWTQSVSPEQIALSEVEIPKVPDFQTPPFVPSDNPTVAITPAESPGPEVDTTAVEPALAKLLGTIRDEAGAIIPGALVEVLEKESGESFQSASDDSGRYELPPMRRGQWELTAELQGFKKYRQAVELAAGEERKLDATLQIGEITDTIEVVSSTPTFHAEVGEAVLSEDEAAQLPLTERNALQLTQLQPVKKGEADAVQQFAVSTKSGTNEMRGRANSGGYVGGVPGGTPGAPIAAPLAPPPPPPAPGRVSTVRSKYGADRDEADKRRPDIVPQPRPDWNTEDYAHIQDNPFLAVSENPYSTFSIDVDTASYANIRRFLNQGQRPPKDAVRIEEMVNYFSYDYAGPTDEHPFAVHVEMAQAPWDTSHKLLKIGLKGKEIPAADRPASNLVFLIDVSGSMQPANKLPLLKQGMKLLVNNLTGKDRVAMVVYAGAAGLVLPSTSCEKKEAVLSALDQLRSGGSTAGAAGIKLAYHTARENFIEGGINRVILATDGDFNVGVSSDSELVRIIEEERKSGVFLSVLGFGMGNYKDNKLEILADKGNGNYAYIDTLKEARKVLVEQMGGTLMTIAKDVKLQIEFNPVVVGGYRLIGYENRMLRTEDFNDDKKDAGEIGAGHTVTALYELIPAGQPVPTPGVDPLRYQQPTAPTAAARSGEALSLKLRYKPPESDTSRLLSYAVQDSDAGFEKASQDFHFAAAVAAYGMLLRESPHKGSASLEMVSELAGQGLGEDPSGHRAEFIYLVKSARGVLD